MLGIYKYCCDCCYGEISGIFIADSEEVKSVIGKGMRMGDVLGKYSDVEIEFYKEDFTLVTEDKKVIDIFQDLNMESGYNVIFLYQCYVEDNNIEDDGF